MRYYIKKFPLLLKEGWSRRLIILYIQYFISRPGWLILWFLLTFIYMKIKTYLTGKVLNFLGHYLGTSPLLLRLSYGTCNWVWWKSAQSTTPAGISICIIIKKWSGHPPLRGGRFFYAVSHLSQSLSWRLYPPLGGQGGNAAYRVPQAAYPFIFYLIIYLLPNDLPWLIWENNFSCLFLSI